MAELLPIQEHWVPCLSSRRPWSGTLSILAGSQLFIELFNLFVGSFYELPISVYLFWKWLFQWIIHHRTLWWCQWGHLLQFGILFAVFGMEILLSSIRLQMLSVDTMIIRIDIFQNQWLFNSILWIIDLLVRIKLINSSQIPIPSLANLSSTCVISCIYMLLVKFVSVAVTSILLALVNGSQSVHWLKFLLSNLIRSLIHIFFNQFNNYKFFIR